MKYFLYIFFAAAVFSSCASEFGKVLKSKDNEYKLKMAEQYYVQKKYDKAQQIYDEIFPYFKGDPRFEDMYFKYAYCAFYSRDYLNAENLFKTFTESFPNSSKEDEAEYMRAFCFFKQSPKVDLDQTNTQKSISLLQAYISTHPESSRIKDATAIMDQCRKKLELKEYKTAQLYYDIGYPDYKAAAVAFTTLMEDFPDSERSDEYKRDVIKSYYKYAEQSYIAKQEERYLKVITECNDFSDRFPDSKYKTEVNDFKTQSQNNINKIRNEQAKETAQR